MSVPARHILMIRPANFGANAFTAADNIFQKDSAGLSDLEISEQALKEFDAAVVHLQSAGIDVIVIEDTPNPVKPDAVFPNNWISFHRNKKVAVYPMFAPIRRLERRMDILDVLEDRGFDFNEIIDYSAAEQEGIFLEGTGSMVLDKQNRKAYCALSKRSDEDLLFEFCEDFEYMPVPFHTAVGDEKVPVYHTNVMLMLTERYAVVCLETVSNKKERKYLIDHFKNDGKEIVSISINQMQHFAGNMLQVLNDKEENILVMSTSAYRILTVKQREALASESRLLAIDIPLIERVSGGSIRCMMAEIYNC